MVPKFVVDINLPGLSAEEQMAACQRFLEEKLEEESATPLTVEPIEGDDNVGVDTRPKVKAAPKKAPTPPRESEDDEAEAPAPKKPSVYVHEVFVILSQEQGKLEGICTLKGQPLVSGSPERFEQMKKAFRSNLLQDPAPAGFKFRMAKFTARVELGEIK